MERRQWQAGNDSWERPRYGSGPAGRPQRFVAPSRPAPQYGEAHPPAFIPDGGAQRPGPWESRPPYETGRRSFPSQDESELRPHTDSRGEFRYQGAPPALPQFLLGGPGPGLPPHARIQEPVPRPGLHLLPRADDVYGREPLPSDGAVRAVPEAAMQASQQSVYGSMSQEDGAQHRDVSYQQQCGERQHGGPQQSVYGSMSQEDGAQHRDVSYQQQCRERQHGGPQQSVYGSMSQGDGAQHRDVSHQQKCGERQHGGPQQSMCVRSMSQGDGAQHRDVSHQQQCGEHRHGGPQHIVDEAPPYRREHPDGFQPGFFHQEGPALPPYTRGGHPPAAPHPGLSRSHLQPQPGMYQGGVQNLSAPPDPFICLGMQPAPLQSTPYSDQPQQGLYRLPPSHGPLPNPPYAVHPAPASVFSDEGDVEVPGPQRHNSRPPHLLEQQPPIMHQDRRQGLVPVMPSGLTAARHVQHEEPERRPNLLLQHGCPVVAQPMPPIEHHFMPTDLEDGRPADRDVFMQWLSGFLSSRRRKPPVTPDVVQPCSIAEARGMIYGALRLVSQLDSLCQALESSDKAGEAWTQDYEKAAQLRVELEKRLKVLEKPGYIQAVKGKLERVRKKRQRRRQATEEEEKAAERSAAREASIDLWRMQCIQKVEEKKRERELKATADHVLGEVRKKQNDVKKMLDVLKALEKLRKLRKEAAGRKGVCPPPSADETFANHIKRLRTMVHSRSALYDAEEMTLRVILEGEQEEERQREKDKRLKKEREKTMHKQRELDSILFGDTEPLPSLHPLQPFRQYYLQAEHSVVSLVHIRHEWDQFLVPPDHPDGSNIPFGWVVPTLPSNDTWATALKPSD